MNKKNKVIFSFLAAFFLMLPSSAIDVDAIGDFSSRSAILNKQNEDELAGEIKEILRSKKLSLSTACLINQIKKNNYENVNILLEAKLNPNYSYFAEYPVYIAVKENNYEITKLLLEYNAKLDRGFFSELFEAVKNKNKELSLLLLENGAKVNYSDSVTNNTILYYALKNNMTDIAALLIEKGARPDMKSVKLIKKKKLYSLVENAA